MAVLWAVQNGYVDDVPVERIKEFQAELTDFLTTPQGRAADARSRKEKALERRADGRAEGRRRPVQADVAIAGR